MRLAAVGVGLLCCSLLGCDFAAPAADGGAWQLSSVPADASLGAPRSGRIVINLDRAIVPQSVSDDSVRLRSGSIVVSLALRLQPVDRQLWLDIDPRAPLDPEVSYRLELEGLVDLDGNLQPKPYVVSFRTGTALGAAPAAVSVDARAVHALLAQRCARAECHGAAAPAAGLDLSSRMGILATAVGARTHTPAGTTGEEGARGASWLSGLRIIDVVAGQGQPATSQLIYKVLGDPHVQGDPMPPTGPRLTLPELRAISAWVELGAPAD